MPHYEIYYCPIHKKTIYYFNGDKYITGYWHCWECIKERNDGTFTYPYRITKEEDYGNV